MIRTVSHRCKLPKEAADAFNIESGRISTHVLVQHYRIYRKKGVWLSPGSMEKLSDKTENRDRKPLLTASMLLNKGSRRLVKPLGDPAKQDWMPRTRTSVSASGQPYGKTPPLGAGTPAYSYRGVVAHGLQA